MLAYVLALIVGLGSFSLYMAAFFFPEIYRKYDLIWSGVGLFYALVLWFCAGRITGAVLLGQTASVALLVWFGWQTLQLRRQLTLPDQQTPMPSLSEVQTQLSGLVGSQRFSQLATQLRSTVTTAINRVQATLQKSPPAAETTASSPAEVPPEAEGPASASTPWTKVTAALKAITDFVQSILGSLTHRDKKTESKPVYVRKQYRTPEPEAQPNAAATPPTEVETAPSPEPAVPEAAAELGAPQVAAPQEPVVQAPVPETAGSASVSETTSLEPVSEQSAEPSTVTAAIAPPETEAPPAETAPTVTHESQQPPPTAEIAAEPVGTAIAPPVPESAPEALVSEETAVASTDMTSTEEKQPTANPLPVSDEDLINEAIEHAHIGSAGTQVDVAEMQPSLEGSDEATRVAGPAFNPRDQYLFGRFSDQTRQVILIAQEETHTLGHAFIGPEQLLLGLIAEETSVAAQTLRNMGVSFNDVRAEVAKLVAPGPGMKLPEISFTQDARRVLDAALEESRKTPNNPLEPEHLLLGLSQIGNSIAAIVLKNLGIELQDVRDRLIQLMNEG